MVVTGGSRGIGAATVRLAAERGYDVAVNYRSEESAARAVGEAAQTAGARVLLARGDIANEDDVTALFRTVDKAFGRLDVLVNNAGVTGPSCRLEGLNGADLARVLAVNVAGTMLAAREAVRRMSTRHGGRGGAIVNVSSRAAVLGGAGEWLHYAASKGAIETFTVGLGREVAAEGIRVNAVSPGLIGTDIHAPAGGSARLSRLTPSVPEGRVGEAQEVARAILYLAGEEASYVVGASLPVSGGR